MSVSKYKKYGEIKKFQPGEIYDYVHTCSMHKSKIPILTSGLIACTAIVFSDTEGNNYLIIHGSNIHPLLRDHAEDDVVYYLEDNPDIRIHPEGVHVVTGRNKVEKGVLKRYLKSRQSDVTVKNSLYSDYGTTGTRPIDHYVGIDNGKLIVRPHIKEESHKKIQNSVGVPPRFDNATTFQIKEEDLLTERRDERSSSKVAGGKGGGGRSSNKVSKKICKLSTSILY